MGEATKVSELGVTLTQQESFRFEVHFDERSFAPIVLDEPPPLGKDEGPNAARMLAAAIGNCLAASLVFCLGKRGAKVQRGIRAHVTMEIVRNAERRLRIGAVAVTLHVPEEIPDAALEACRGAFEDFCTVTQSVRQGLEVEVAIARG